MQLPNPSGATLFLDFDGVICDSVNECFVSSWIAYHNLESKGTSQETEPVDLGNLPSSVSIDSRREFARYRPFIRRGGDYVTLQHCISQGIRIEKQEDLDSLEARLGRSEKNHAQFYRARTQVLNDDPTYWLSLNPLYGEVLSSLSGLAQSSWIITTKEAEFARRILEYHGVSWDLDRIICSGKRRKLDVIKELRSEYITAVLIDDQIDHLKANESPSIGCVLAAWGYIQPEWIGTAAVPVLNRDEIETYLRKFL